MSEITKRQWLALALWTVAWLIPAGALVGYAVYRNNAHIAQQMEQAQERHAEFQAAWLREHSPHDSRP